MALRNRSEKVEMLQQIPIFSHLTKKQLQEVARHADELEMEDGRMLAREGTVGHELFVIGERDFKPLLASTPDLSLRLLRSMAQRLREADEALTH